MASSSLTQGNNDTAWSQKNSATIPAHHHLLFSIIAPQLAVIFTNPFDTAKVRLQLQKTIKGSTRIYRNSIDALVKIYLNEGISGLQKGLFPALLREGSKNVFRIGLFEPLLKYMHPPEQNGGSKPPMWKRMIAGGVSGALGAFACNPFELIKTRMQAFASNPSIAVGHQHQYKGFFHASVDIIRTEGILSLYRGSSMNVIRSLFGSSTNLATYSWMREYLISHNYMDNSLTDATCAMASSFITALVMNPVDVIRTRIYNQAAKIGNMGSVPEYNSGIDALLKVVRNEGPLALFKGFFASFLRLGPHFTLTFVFFEQLKRLSLRASEKRQRANLQAESF